MNKKQLLVIFQSVAVFVVLFTTVSVASAGKYRFVTFEYPPYEYTEGGYSKGIAVEIVKETFRQLNHEITIEFYPWARSIEMFKSGEVDGIFTMFKNAEREEFTLFSKESVVIQPVSLWVLKDSKISFNGDLASVKPYRFGTARKISYGSKFDRAVKEGRVLTEVSDNIEGCINKLLVNRVDIWISNRYGAIYELKRAGHFDKVKELSPLVQEIPTYIGFSKKRNMEKLRNDFDKALAKYKKSGKYEKLIKNYMDKI